MRIFSYILTAILLIPAAGIRAEVVTSGNFKYEIVRFFGYDEDEAVVVGLSDGFVPSGELSFPATINHKGKAMKVTGLGWSNHTSHEGDDPVIGGFDGITSVRIPRYMRFIGRIEFKNCPAIEKYEVESGSETYTAVGGALVELDVSSGTLRRRLVRYPSASKAASYVVPSSIDFIEFGAFAATSCLKKIFLVGEQSLLDCWQYNNRSIETVDCTNSTEYSTDAVGAIFSGPVFIGLCPGRVYTSYTVPESCAYLSGGAFCNAQVDEVIFPAKLSQQGAESYMFLESEVRKVTYLGSAPYRFWEGAFMGCANLESIAFGADADGSLDIHTCAFKDCRSLATVTFAETTGNIGIAGRAFENCRSLTAFPLTQKMKIKSLGNREFAGCESLTSFSFSCVRDFHTPLTGYIFAGSGLRQVHWPTGHSVVPRGCFADCRNLTKVYLKDTTADIYEEAFARSGLVALNMMGVDWWSCSAFAGCTDLVRLYFPDNGKAVQYHPVAFLAESPQIVVNNPKISYLHEQEEYPGVASLYISMVNGGVTIGNGWRKVYVPGRASELYSQLTASEVQEMFSYETYPDEGAVKIIPLVAGVKITSVAIEGETASCSGSTYSVGKSFGGSTMNVTVSYTVFGNVMTSTYSEIYGGVDEMTVFDDGEPGQWFTLSGTTAGNAPSAPGIYIRRTGRKAVKVIVR